MMRLSQNSSAGRGWAASRSLPLGERPGQRQHLRFLHPVCITSSSQSVRMCRPTRIVDRQTLLGCAPLLPSISTPRRGVIDPRKTLSIEYNVLIKLKFIYARKKL